MHMKMTVGRTNWADAPAYTTRTFIPDTDKLMTELFGPGYNDRPYVSVEDEAQDLAERLRNPK